MKKILIIFLLLAVVGFAGYFMYDKYLGSSNGFLWDYVPANALVVYESTAPVDTWNNLVGSSMGRTLDKIPAFKTFNNTLLKIDSLNGNGNLGALLSNELLISIHTSSKNKLGFSFYIKLDNQKENLAFSKIIEGYEKLGYSLGNRLYQGDNIYELNKSEGTPFSYYVDGNVLIGSPEPFLIEDVIRTIKQGTGFRADNAEVFDLPQLNNDDGNIFVNVQRTPLLLGTFTSSINTAVRNSGRFASSSFLDMNLEDDKVFLNGFTTYNDTDFLNTFKGQEPVSSSVKYFISNQTAHYVQFAFNSADQWYTNVKTYWSQCDEQYFKEHELFLNQYNLGKWSNWVGKSLTYSTLESNSKEGNHLLYIQTEDANEGLNKLNALGESVAQVDGDSVYVERYANYEIREMPIESFPRKYFGRSFSGFKQSYYTLVEDFIVFSPSIKELKQLFDDIASENTWGRSVLYNKFLETTLEESNFSIVINTERSLPAISPSLSSEWTGFVQENRSALESFGLISMQWSILDENFYTSIAAQHITKKDLKAERFNEVQTNAVDKQIITKPFVVKNHVSNLREVIVQDSAYNIKLIGNDMQVLWTDSIGEPIVGELVQVDFYDNDKLQNFFTTSSKIHIVDRLGNEIEGFPMEVNFPIRFSNVVDYDNSKRYRFLVADDRGNLYLYSKEGNLLEGWEPLSLNGPLATQPFHIRVRKKDCFVVLQQDGTVTVINRRGETMPGFPLSIESRVYSDIAVSYGSDFSQTILTTISRDGQLFKFNLNGKVVETKQLYKPTKDSQFRVIPDALEKSYVIVRRDLNRLVILDESGNEMLAKDYLSAEGMEVQFYDFSNSNKLYAMTDPVQGFSYLYNKDGVLINAQPINSDHEIGVIYSEARGEFKVYCVSGNTFQILQF